MNVEQVIDEIGKAVTAMQPAQEYCLFGFWGVTWWPLCMTKSEWAAWVQGLAVCVTLIAPTIFWLVARSKEKKVLRLILNGYSDKIDKIDDYIKNGYSVFGVEVGNMQLLSLIESCVKFIRENRIIVENNSSKSDTLFKSKLSEFYRLIDNFNDEIVVAKTNLKNNSKDVYYPPDFIKYLFADLHIKESIDSIISDL